jgi:hypothetical protein
MISTEWILIVQGPVDDMAQIIVCVPAQRRRKASVTRELCEFALDHITGGEIAGGDDGCP